MGPPTTHAPHTIKILSSHGSEWSKTGYLEVITLRGVTVPLVCEATFGSKLFSVALVVVGEGSFMHNGES